MNSLLKQISDANLGIGKLNAGYHVSNAKHIFSCPMISMYYLDCIESDIVINRIAREEISTTRFYSNNCLKRTLGNNMSGVEIAKTCPRFQNGSNCWGEITSELLQKKQR